MFSQQFQHGDSPIQFAVDLPFGVAHPGAAVVRLCRPTIAHMDELSDDPLGFHLASKARRAGTLLDFIPCTSPTTSFPTSAGTQGGNQGGLYNTGPESMGRDRRKRNLDHQLCNFIRNKRPGGSSVAATSDEERGGLRETNPLLLQPVEVQGDEDRSDGGEATPELPKTPTVHEVDSEDSQKEDDTPSPPHTSLWRLWDFVKGFTPPRVHLHRRMFGGLGLKTSEGDRRSGGTPTTEGGMRTTETPREVVKVSEIDAKHETKGEMDKSKKRRATLPNKALFKVRPNVNKIVVSMKKRYNNHMKAKEKLEKDFSANSSRAPQLSRRTTVAKFLNQRFGKDKWIPADEEVVKELAAILKEAGYKSAKLYLTELKMIHLEAGHEWSGHLHRILQQCKSAATRGQGPKKKAVEVPEDVWAQNYEDKINKKVKIIEAQRLFALGVQWMMREIEIADLTLENVNFNFRDKTVSLTWDTSKTDPEARTISRMLQCLCGQEGCDIRCPYDNLKEIVKMAKTFAGDGIQHICLDIDGNPATKNQVLNSWRQLFGKKVSGHSTRRSGALQYIRKGWSVSQVAFLGRWRSNIILQYADEALQSIPVNASANFNMSNHNTPVLSQQRSMPADPVIQQEIVLELKEEIARLKSGEKSVKDKLKDLQDKWVARPSREDNELPKMVKSLRSGIVHQNASYLLCSPPYTWRTTCGWAYNSAAYSFVQEPMAVNCQKCMAPRQGKEVRNAAG